MNKQITEAPDWRSQEITPNTPADKALTAPNTGGNAEMADDASFRAMVEKSPWMAREMPPFLTGGNAAPGDTIAAVPFGLNNSEPASPGLKTGELVKAADRFVTDFAVAYDTNEDGMFENAELRALANAALDVASANAPSLLASRDVMLAAVERVGTVSTEQLKVMLTKAAEAVDANRDGVVDPEEFQNLLRPAPEFKQQR